MFVKLIILMCPNAINVNVALVFLLLILVTTSSLYLDRFSTMENLQRKKYPLMYNGGSPIPVGTSGKLPDYVNYDNILDFYFKIRFKGGVSFYVALDNSTNTNIVDYTLFNGIRFELNKNTNILKLIADPKSEFLSIDIFSKLT
nr:MAG TPA: hypothetical protein [Caudoviricetes sp.]